MNGYRNVAHTHNGALLLLLLLSRFSHVRLLATPCTAAHQAPLSIGFSMQEYWSGVPLPSQPLKRNPAICSNMDATRDSHTK